MAKWWLLLTGFVLWLAVGFVARPPRATDAQAQEAPHSPTRIVSMAPNLTEILFALGLDAQIAGVTNESDYPPAAIRKRRVGSFWQPGIEPIIATRPDLVVTLGFQQHRDLARRLDRMGCDCRVMDVETVDDLFDTIRVLGRSTGRQVEARRLENEMRLKLVRIRETTTDLPRVKVLWVVQREPLRVAGRETFVNEIIELAGGENAIGPTLHKYPPIGAEQVIASSPEVIIEPAMVGTDLDGQRRQAMAYWSRFENVPAVANGRICVVDGDLVSRLSPRLPAGVGTVARCLYPSLFGE